MRELLLLIVVWMLVAGAGFSAMATPASALKPPFPYFGNKRLAAPLVWAALGPVKNYAEPFAGSLAVLLGRPDEPQREVVNDIDCFVVNFWRAVRASPEEVWYWADDLVAELQVHARHRWLVDQQRELRAKMLADPEFFDARVAGWWVWGLSAWIGSGWCPPEGRHLARSIPRARPGGIHSLAVADLVKLGERLRRVQVTCGDWQRVLTPAYSTSQGLTGVLLDPPYSEGADGLYGEHDKSLSARVRDWAVEHGDDPLYRIALCGYEGEHKLPKRWRVKSWKARPGYGATRKQGAPNLNRHRERLWLSPHCLEVA
jgi:DNA adenine methylase